MRPSIDRDITMALPALPPKPPYRDDLFEPSNFSSSSDIQNALMKLGQVLNKQNFERVLEDLLEHRLALELVVSGLQESIPLASWLIESFPTTAPGYNTSLGSKVLSRLSLFFVFQSLPLQDPVATGDILSRYHRGVNATPKLLSALLGTTFESELKQEALEAPKEADMMPHYFKVKAKRQSKRSKAGNKGGMMSKLPQSTRILEDFSIPVPCGEEEAETAILKVLTDAKSILKFYLDVLRVPEVDAVIQKAFIQHKGIMRSSPEHKIMMSQASALEEKVEVAISSAYPFVQPMKSALHFNSVDGFGEWRILISTRADGDLREARRKDRKMFSIIVKKIKDLSNGHFSDDNQKRLSGPNTDVPIFEAKMTRDTRLVYQVDSISEYDSQAERQVLRIFGIYTHAQLDNRLWESVGRQLGKKGKEYKRRCMHRERPALAGDNVYFPASFPPLEKEAALSSVIDLPPDDLEQIHSLLVLEKYMTFSQELLHSVLADLDVAFPFQVSAQEQEIIEHPFSCYVLGRSGTGKTTTMLYKMLWIERTFQLNSSDIKKPRQIFVTKSRVLAGKVEEHFLKLSESLKITSKSPEELKKFVAAKKGQANEDDLRDLDDEDTWRNDLPARFSELEDSHFPLFVTFDRLCDLIEADFNTCQRTSNTGENKKLRTFVSYDLFLHQYWPHLPQTLIKGLDPALVFSEIIGIIKGSEDSIISPNGYLDRKTYEELSERTQSTFATQRSVIYNIFEAYQVRKGNCNAFDAADRTHGILRGFIEHGIVGKKVDQLCIDEAQDNLLIDALLLRSLSCNKDGLFWAGDTAQTISVGSAFRFDDLKAFLFRVEKRQLESNILTGLKEHTQSTPKTFQLTTNYRSHAGIVNCARSVIELIGLFWPYSIDALAPEKGIVDGHKPVFLNGWDTDNVRYEQFLFGSSGTYIEFGAEQCILVRDEVACQKLQEQVGNIGTIMTLYDSKGLEFNDVLLYNFFEDSTVELAQWRLLLNAVNDNAGTAVAAPQFDRTRHAGICVELKSLYVAITRARKNFWIADQSKKGEPMRVFWTARDQIHNCTPEMDMPRLAVSSSPEEWASKGKELFERKKYFQAKHCYERALMPREMAISNAYYLREQARKGPPGETRAIRNQRHTAFVTAAEVFLLCAQEANKNRFVYYQRAAECLEAGAEDLRAAHTYLNACDYDTAAKLFRKLGNFDEAINVIKANEKNMRNDIVENIKDVARLYYFREAKLEKARELFLTDEEELKYLEDLDLDIARAEVLISLGRAAEAAELHLSEGRMLEAIPLFLEDSTNTESIRQACQCILRQFWYHFSFNVFGQGPIVTQLIYWSSKLKLDILDPIARDEIFMFKAIISHNKIELAKLATSFLSTGNTTAATLCLNQYFREFPRTAMMTAQELAETLHLFHNYTRNLYEFAFHVDLRVATSVQTLFCVQPTSGDEFSIPINTFLHQFLGERVSKKTTEEGSLITGWELSSTFKRAIRSYLQRRVSEQVEIYRTAQQLFTCLTFVTFGYCNRIECPHRHTSAAALTKGWYNARVRVNLQQILILQIAYSLGAAGYEDINKQKRIYVGRIYEAINPSFYYLGDPSHLNTELIPEFRRGIQVIKEWLRELAYTFDFRIPQFQFLTDLIRTIGLALMFDRRDALQYLGRSPCFSSEPKLPQYLRPPNGDFFLAELLRSLEGSRQWSIAAGILSFVHILKFKLPINISTLCDFIEYICASFVFAHGLHRKNPLHGITLPRSWLLRSIEQPEEAKAVFPPMNLCTKFIEPICELLETIYSGVGAEFLLFDTASLATIPSARGVFITRICRALCLLGYNINLELLRLNILKSITSLQRLDRRFHPLYRRFVTAQRWAHLVNALRNMVQGSLIDELLQLHNLGHGPIPVTQVPGVRLIHFKFHEDLLELLGTPMSFSMEPVNINPEPHSSHQIGMLDESFSIQSSHEASDSIIPDDHEDADDIEEVLGANPTEAFEEQSVLMMSASDMPQAPPVLPDELRAASVFLKLYKQKLLCRRQETSNPSTPLIISKFSACLERAGSGVCAQNPKYRVLFLGPLPHLLLCLDIVFAAASEQKKVTKKRLLVERHENLDSLGVRLTVLGQLSKSLSRLQKMLEPNSSLHRRNDIFELRRIVEETVALLQDLPFSVPQTFSADLAIAVKGIIAKKQPSRVTAKPSLVWDDTYESNDRP